MDPGEACDDGALNGKGTGRCMRDCSALCGDRVVSGTETCDEGPSNGQSNHCSSGCGFVCIGACPVHIDLRAPPGGDGTSWEKAYNTLEVADVNGPAYFRSLWVAEGVYTPVPGISLSGIRPGELYGGFAGNEGRLSERNIEAHPTVLDGKDVYGWQFFATWTIDGLTFTRGAGFASFGECQLRNLKFIANKKFGLGLYESGPKELRNVDILDNVSAGAYLIESSDAADTTFTDVRIVGNTGNILLREDSTLRRIQYRNNTGTTIRLSPATIDESQFEGVTLTTDIFMGLVSSSTFKNSTVQLGANPSRDFVPWRSSISGSRFDNCTIKMADTEGEKTISSSVFVNSRVDLIIAQQQGASITGSTFVNTPVAEAGGYPMDISSSTFVYGGTPQFTLDQLATLNIEYSTFYSTASPAVPPWSSAPHPLPTMKGVVVWPAMPTDVTATYSCFSGASGATNKALTRNPFVIADNDGDGVSEYYLDPSSACVNGGDPAESRFSNQTTNVTGCTDAPPVDIGRHHAARLTTPCP